MSNCSIALQVLPQIDNKLYVSGGESNKNDVFRVVDEVIKYIDAQGVKYVVSPFETVMEGDFDTGNVRYKARERYSFGVSDPLGIFGSPGA